MITINYGTENYFLIKFYCNIIDNSLALMLLLLFSLEQPRELCLGARNNYNFV